MGAICKTIPIHSKSTVPLLKYCADKEKTSLSRNLKANPDLSISDALDYAANPLKTICNIDEDHKELLISGVGCDPNTAAAEFAMVRDDYLSFTGKAEDSDPFEFLDRRTGEIKTVKKEPVTAIHLIQSFEETNLDPHVVHQIGIELAERMGYQAVVDTHMNKEHLHNHIIINAYRKDGKKVLDNLENRMKIREMSDRIQREYGIGISFRDPEKQLKTKRGKTKNYKEILSDADGLSWKDQMRQDVLTVAGVARDRNEYLSMMESYGYKVKTVSDKMTTFIVEENGKTIRDTTLGAELGIGELYPMMTEPEEGKKCIPDKPLTISLSRYDSNGRRRSDLEMLLRKAIAVMLELIRVLGGRQKEETEKKIRNMNAAIELAINYDISSPSELKSRLLKKGAELSHVKAELRSYEAEKDLYKTLSEAVDKIEELRKIKTHTGDLMLQDYTEEQIREKKASLAPLSPEIKSDIAVALHRHPEYRITCKYTRLTAREAKQCLDFLNGRTTERPKVVVPAEEFERINALKLADKLYYSRVAANQERYGNKEAGIAAAKQTCERLASKGYILDPAKLSQADVMDINNCLASNPFGGTLIDDEQQEALNRMLASKGMKANRPAEFILTGEYEHIVRYLEGKTGSRPSVLDPFVPPYEKDLENLHKIMKAKGIYSSVPVDSLSKADAARMLTYAVSSGRVPAAVGKSPASADKSILDNLFREHIKGYQIERQLYLSELRAAINTLRAMGYEVDVNADLGKVKDDIACYQKQKDELETEKEKLGSEYRDLLVLKQSALYAQDQRYLYGELYDLEVQPFEVRETGEKEPEEKKDKGGNR